MFFRPTRMGCILLACWVALPGCGVQEPGTQGLVEPAGRVPFVHNLEVGIQQAAAAGKPCLLFFTAEWCTYCHHMQESTLGAPQVQALARKFVCVVVDADQHPEICRHYSVSGFPTVQFIASNGQPLHKLVGWQSPEALHAGMGAALERFTWIAADGKQLR